jgi:tetratricopeptide (TPR) repeat protein
MKIVAHCAGLASALVCSCLLLACSNPERSYSAHVERGRRYMDEGNLQKAQIEFRNAIQVLPAHADAHVMGGQVAERLGDLRTAISLYQSAIDVDPNNIAARAYLGRIYVLTGNPERGLEVIATALQRYPDDPMLLTVRGAGRAKLGDTSSALTDAERAVQLAPHDEDAVALLAGLYQQAGNTQHAVDLLRRTLEARPDSVDLHRVLAGLYEKLDQPASAEAQLQEIVAERPQDFVSRADLVAFYVRTSRIDDAERTLKAAMAELPNQDQARLAYIEFLSQWRSREQRDQALADMLARNPRDYALQLAHGVMQWQENESDAAAATYEAIIAAAGERPDGLSARNRLAAILITQRRFTEASVLVQQVLQVSNRDASALELRANIALERGEAASAITDLRTVLRDQPGSAPILRSLAKAYLSDGETSLAEESLRSAVDRAAGDPAARIELAQLLANTQRLDAAIVLLVEAVHRYPRDMSACEALVRAYIAKPDFKAAQGVAIDAIKASPDDWRGPYLEALVAESQQRPEPAIAALEQALTLQPDALEVLQEISRLDSAGGKADQAISRLRLAVSKRPDNAALHELLGTLLSGRDSAAATGELRRAIDLRPGWWVPYHELGRIQVAAGDAAQAAKTLQQGVDATRLEVPLVEDLATLYERQGRPQEAMRLYDRFGKDFPGSVFGSNNLAVLLVTYGKDRASLERARDLTARFMTATNPDLLDTAGWVRFKLGDTATALPVLEEAARRAPTSGIVRYHLGMAQLQMGQRAAARASLESAVAGPNHFEGWDDARATLARLRG